MSVISYGDGAAQVADAVMVSEETPWHNGGKSPVPSRSLGHHDNLAYENYVRARLRLTEVEKEVQNELRLLELERLASKAKRDAEIRHLEALLKEDAGTLPKGSETLQQSPEVQLSGERTARLDSPKDVKKEVEEKMQVAHETGNESITQPTGDAEVPSETKPGSEKVGENVESNVSQAKIYNEELKTLKGSEECEIMIGSAKQNIVVSSGILGTSALSEAQTSTQPQASQDKQEDIKVENIPIAASGKGLFVNASLQITRGQWSSLVEPNSHGKTILLRHINSRFIDTPSDIDVLLCEREVSKDAFVQVVIPSKRSVVASINRLFDIFVSKGPQFEPAVVHREQNNAQFTIMPYHQSLKRKYHRWKLRSIHSDESVDNWRREELRRFKDGLLRRPPPVNLFSGEMPESLIEKDDYFYAIGYVPPPKARRGGDSDGMYDDSHAEAPAISRRCDLTEVQRRRFTHMLSDSKPPGLVGDVVVLPLEHADSTGYINDCIIESCLTLAAIQLEDATEDRKKALADETKATVTETENSNSLHGRPITRFVVRLFLASDIFYNYLAKASSTYFCECLGDHFSGLVKLLQSDYENEEEKPKGERPKQTFMKCCRVSDDLIKLQNIFLELVTETDDEAELTGALLESNINIARVTEDPNFRRLTTIDVEIKVLGERLLEQCDGGRWKFETVRLAEKNGSS